MVLTKANQTWPAVVIYVETNETETEVLDNVKQWLYGSNGDVKLVIVITTHEENILPSEISCLNGLDCRSWSDPYQLAEVIYKVESQEERRRHSRSDSHKRVANGPWELLRRRQSPSFISVL